MLTDGRVVHFSVMARGKKQYLGVEVFERGGRFVGYGEVANYKSVLRDEPLFFFVRAKDAQDRFYVARKNRSGAPVVSVYRLQYEVED